MLLKYNVKSNWERPEIIEKIKKSNLEKYGVENVFQSEKIKEKIRQTTFKNHSVKCYLEKRTEIKKAMLKKYGVEYPLQNKEIFEKSFKTRIKLKQYKSTNLTYQGSYELDFLEKFYDKIDISNGPSIPYLYKGARKVYHSDFYIPSKNLIVEIKSSYILTLDIEINEKKEACIKQGYNYILILDKDYSKIIVEL